MLTTAYLSGYFHTLQVDIAHGLIGKVHITHTPNISYELDFKKAYFSLFAPKAHMQGSQIGVVIGNSTPVAIRGEVANRAVDKGL